MSKVKQDCFGNIFVCKAVCEHYNACLTKSIEIDMKLEIRG